MPETTECKLCGSETIRTRPCDSWFLDLTDPFQVCECEDCGLLFMSPRPTPQELIEMYSKEPYFSRENANRGASRTEFYTARMHRLGKAVKQKGCLLGIGCLEGGYALELAQELGWQVTGVESSEILASYARENLAVNVQTVDSWDLSSLPEKSFDAVYTHSFEHFSDPRSMLAHCHRVLKSGGTVMIEVPNQFYSLKDKIRRGLMQVLGENRYKIFRKPPPFDFHLFFYGKRTIRELLSREGFNVQRIKTYIPRHPVYLRNPKGKWVQEALYAVGGLFGRGPSLEIVATADSRPP